MKNNIKQNLKAIILGLVIAAGSSYALADWKGPTSTPPDGNASAPINVDGGVVGNIYSQAKSGLLTLDNLIANTVNGGFKVTNSVGTFAGIPSGSVLTADGDNTGKVKWTAPDSGGGSANVIAGTAGWRGGAQWAGLNETPSQSFTLPTGSYKVTITAAYFSCYDYMTSLKVDSVAISTIYAAQGYVAADTEGCDQNTILGSIVLQGGNHTLSVARPAGYPVAGAAGISEVQFLWTAYKN